MKTKRKPNTQGIKAAYTCCGRIRITHLNNGKYLYYTLKNLDVLDTVVEILDKIPDVKSYSVVVDNRKSSQGYLIALEVKDSFINIKDYI